MTIQLFRTATAIVLTATIVFASLAYAASSESAHGPQANEAVVTELLGQAKDKVDTGDLSVAVNHIEHAIRISPREARSWHLLSEVYERQGLLDEAQTFKAKAQSLDPNPAGLTKEHLGLRSHVASSAEEPDLSHPQLVDSEPNRTWVDSHNALAQTLDGYDYSAIPRSSFAQRTERNSHQTHEHWSSAEQAERWDDSYQPTSQESDAPWLWEDHQAGSSYASLGDWKRDKRDVRKERKAAKRERRMERKAAKRERQAQRKAARRQWQQERQAVQQAWRSQRNQAQG